MSVREDQHSVLLSNPQASSLFRTLQCTFHHSHCTHNTDNALLTSHVISRQTVTSVHTSDRKNTVHHKHSDSRGFPGSFSFYNHSFAVADSCGNGFIPIPSSQLNQSPPSISHEILIPFSQQLSVNNIL